MKYSIKTEDFSTQFIVFDSENLERYFVKNEMDSVMRKLTISDLADEIICTIEKQFFALRPTYVITNTKDEIMINIRKNLNLLHPEFTITSELEEIKYHTIGDFFGSNFSITNIDENEIIAKITRTNGYTIEILDEEQEPFIFIAILIIEMNLSDEAIQYGRDAVKKLVNEQCRIPVRSTTPISFYYQQSNSLIDEADFYYKNQEFDRSFILYSRYITLFVEELKHHHPAYGTVSINEQQRVKDIIRTKAFPRAEESKIKLREKYAQDYEMKKRAIQDEENAKISTNTIIKPTIDILNENQGNFQQSQINYKQYPPSHVAFFAMPTTESNRPIIDRTRKPISNSINSDIMNSFRRVIVPNDITLKFLEVAQKNTERKIETCGILAGIRVNQIDELFLNSIYPPSQK